MRVSRKREKEPLQKPAEPRAQTLHLERRAGSLQDWGGCIISGIVCKGPLCLAVQQAQTQCISLGLGEMTSLQRSVIVWLALIQASAWRGTGDQSLLETCCCRIQKSLPANLIHSCIAFLGLGRDDQGLSGITLAGGMIIDVRFGHGDTETVDLKILKEMRKTSSRLKTMDFRRAQTSVSSNHQRLYHVETSFEDKKSSGKLAGLY